MAFPTIPTVAAGRVLFTTTNTNPAGGHVFPDLSSLTKNAGDLLIAIIVQYAGNSTNAEYSSWGGGFTEFCDQSAVSNTAIGAAYKWSTGSETGTFSVTSVDTSVNDSVTILLSIPGAHASTPPEAGTITNGSGAAADIAALNPTGWDAEDTLWIAVCAAGETGTGGSFTAPSAAPTNYGNLAVSALTGDVVGGMYGAVAFRQLNASSEDPGTFTVDTGNARNSALLIAVRPVETITLVVDDATQAQSTDSIALTQVHELVVADSTQVQSTDAIALTQVHELVVQDSTQAHTADEVGITLVTDLVVQDATQAQSTDLIALTQVHELVAQDSTQAQSTDSITLTQVHELVVEDSTQVQSTDSIALIQVHELVVQDSTQLHTVESPSLIQVHELVVQDALQSHTVDNLVLEENSGGATLVIQDATQSHTVDNLVLTQVHELVVQDATQSHTVDNIGLVLDLVVQDATQSHSVDNLTLTQAHELVVQDATQFHTVDNLVVSENLVVQNSLQTHAVDNVELAQTLILQVRDATQLQVADNIALIQVHELVVQDSTHAQATSGKWSGDITLTTTVEQELEVEYHTRNLVTPAKVFSLKYDVRKDVSRSVSVEYGVRVPIATPKTVEVQYDTRQRIELTFSIVYDVEVVGLTEVSKEFEIRYHTLNSGGQELSGIVVESLDIPSDGVVTGSVSSPSPVLTDSLDISNDVVVHEFVLSEAIVMTGATTASSSTIVTTSF